MAYKLTIKRVLEANAVALERGNLAAMYFDTGSRDCYYFYPEKVGRYHVGCSIGVALPAKVLQELVNCGSNGTTIFGYTFRNNVDISEKDQDIIDKIQEAHDGWLGDWSDDGLPGGAAKLKTGRARFKAVLRWAQKQLDARKKADA